MLANRISVLCLFFAKFCPILQFPAGLPVAFIENRVDFFQSWKFSSLKQLQDEIFPLFWKFIYKSK